jgi:carbonic anhydrase
MLSGSSVSVVVGPAIVIPRPTKPTPHVAMPVLGKISGAVTNPIGRPIAGIKVELINANNVVAARTITGAKGLYSFKIFYNGAYTVREVTGSQWTQTSPTFTNTAPSGSYAPGASSSSWNFNTTGNTNPAFGPVGVYGWDTIAPAGNLPFQSPINITVPPTDLSKYLTINYNPGIPTQIVNNGHEIQAQYPGSLSDSITVGGQTFELAQFHFHDPSETQVYGKGYSMEMHFVNMSATGAKTVVAVFLQVGAHNPSLQPILDSATSSLSKAGSSTTISSPINFAGLLPTSMQGWFYQGSFTGPPLSQPVNWFVLSTPITLDFAQLKQYEAVASGAGFLPNARPVQSLDGRQVNQFNFDVNFQSQTVAGLNFTLLRNPPT